MEKKQKSRGRPIKNKVDHIPESAENIAKAIFRGADKKLSTDSILEKTLKSLDSVEKRASNHRKRILNGVRKPGKQIPL